MKLRTLKDIDMFDNIRIDAMDHYEWLKNNIDIEKLVNRHLTHEALSVVENKEQFMKDIRRIEERRVAERIAVMEWIKYFFNLEYAFLEEEDLE